MSLQSIHSYHLDTFPYPPHTYFYHARTFSCHPVKGCESKQASKQSKEKANARYLF